MATKEQMLQEVRDEKDRINAEKAYNQSLTNTEYAPKSGFLKGIGDEIVRGARRVGQDLGIAEDPNKYKKTPMGEAMTNSDAAKGARNYIRMYKEGLGMKGKNDEYEYKKGGKVSSASKRADGCAQRGKTKGTMITMKGGGNAC
jgi:hypothetical protein